MGSTSHHHTDLLPSQTGHLLESKIFRNFTRLSRKKPKTDLPNIKMSDLLESSDSGNEKTDFINDVECTSQAHEWRKLINIILPVSVEALRNELFTKSKFMDDFHSMRKHCDLDVTEWERYSDDGKRRRIIKYKMPLTTNMGFGPKYSLVTQNQTESNSCIPNRLYVVDVVNSNEHIPYGDVFEVAIHHCILSTIDDHSMYSVFGQVRYKKSVWGVVKSRIEKNCLAGMDDFFVELQTTLQKELCTPPSKGKRSSRKKLSRNDSSTFSITQPSSNQNQCNKTEAPLKPIEASQSIETSILMWSIFCVLIAVTAMSIVLLFKLWVLEKEFSLESIPDYESLRSTERSSEEWMHLLRNQQKIHETEVVKWIKVLEVAISLIQNTEKTLVELLGHIQLKEILEAHSTGKSHKNMQMFNENESEVT